MPLPNVNFFYNMVAKSYGFWAFRSEVCRGNSKGDKGVKMHGFSVAFCLLILAFKILKEMGRFDEAQLHSLLQSLLVRKTHGKDNGFKRRERERNKEKDDDDDDDDDDDHNNNNNNNNMMGVLSKMTFQDRCNKIIIPLDLTTNDLRRRIFNWRERRCLEWLR